MMSPFDSKNRVATALDRLALRVLLFLLSVGYFFALWHSGAPSLLAGSALFALANAAMRGRAGRPELPPASPA